MISYQQRLVLQDRDELVAENGMFDISPEVVRRDRFLLRPGPKRIVDFS